MSDAIHIVPFSHLDLFWTGTREECLSRGNAIIGRALDLLERHADFRFLVETMNFLDHYLSCHPDDEDRVRRLAQAGRLELAPLWTGIYQNLPGAETLVRNTLYAKRYAHQRFACEPDVAHFGDLPGYTPQFPQIAARSGIRHALLSRGGPAATPLFHWQAPDGSRILSYYVVGGYAVLATRTDWHKDWAAMAGGPMAEILARTTAGRTHATLMHWGCDLYAPHENLVLNARRWNAERTPALRFSTFREYFAEVARTPGLPALQGELPSAWPNIESSWPDIWGEDLPCEAALHLAEFLTAACRLRGWRDHPRRELEDAWKALLDGMDHNQNGQGGERADRDKLQLRRLSRCIAERIIDRMAWRLAGQVPIPAGDAVPIVVFNPLGWQRDGVATARAAIFGSERSSDIGAWDDGVKLIDGDGRTVPYVVRTRREALSLGLEIAFAAHVPAAGHATWYLVPGRNPLHETQTCSIVLDGSGPGETWRYTPDRSVQAGPRRHLGIHRYENRFFRLDIDAVTGDIDITDRADGTKLLAGMRLEAVEERRGNYIFDMTPSGRSFPAIIDRIETLDNHAVWCRIRLHGQLHGMPVAQTITLFPDRPDIAVETVIEWLEPRWVRLEQVFPWAGRGEAVRYGVPFGSVTFPETMPGDETRNSDETPAGQAAALRLASHWVDIGDAAAGLSIGADHRMWEFEGRTLRSYLLRGAGYCAGIERDEGGTARNIARPPPGTYRFQHVLRPRRGSEPAYRCGWELNHPLHAVSVCGGRPGVDGPARSSLIDASDTPLVVTAIKLAEDGDAVIARAFDAGGAGAAFAVPRLGGVAALESDMLEQARTPAAAWRPHEIKTLAWDLPREEAPGHSASDFRPPA